MIQKIIVVKTIVTFTPTCFGSSSYFGHDTVKATYVMGGAFRLRLPIVD